MRLRRVSWLRDGGGRQAAERGRGRGGHGLSLEARWRGCGRAEATDLSGARGFRRRGLAAARRFRRQGSAGARGRKATEGGGRPLAFLIGSRDRDFQLPVHYCRAVDEAYQQTAIDDRSIKTLGIAIAYYPWNTWLLLFFLAQLYALLSTSDGGNITHLPDPFLCHLDQAKSLLQLKKSFLFGTSTTILPSWQDGTDCCLWEGVGCDASSGNITALDLNNYGLSSYSLDPSIFTITSLRRLDLSMNDFSGGRWDSWSTIWSDTIPAYGFERLTLLTHLNLSNSGLYGLIPIGISKLANLLSLDLSGPPHCYDGIVACNSLGSDFNTLLANLSNLRELYLDGVDMSDSEEHWCTSLATFVPHLQVLSLADCWLSGSIHETLSRIQSLRVINLQRNYDISAGPFPEFFVEFVNLTELQLSDINLEGWFPSRTFRSKHLRVLDLSNNPDLSGHVPNFSNASCLEILRLYGTNIMSLKPTSSSNFMSLKELSLDRNLVSMDFLYSLGRLGSLCWLDLGLESVSDLRPIFSWIGDRKILTSLALTGCNFSMTEPSLVSNFRTLRSLNMVECILPRPILSAIGNLMDLETLEIDNCITYGSMSSSFSNLKILRNIYINNCDLSGPMSSAIGNLTNLRTMYINGGGFSGPMPAGIGNLTNLRSMRIIDGGFSRPMPIAIGNLTNLKTLEIHDAYIGTIPYAIGQLKQLMWLDLAGCNFSGSIPSSIVSLTHLTKLDLFYNSLNGEIPLCIYTLPVLRHLDLSWNQLHGHIQESDIVPSQLEYLDLSKNELSGPIPKTIFQLNNLIYLDVSSNNLIGLVELNSFWTLRNLVSLHLSNNKLCVMDREGHKPLSTYLSGPTELGLASCKITQFPISLMHSEQISYLDLSCNNISGAIPNHVWEAWSDSLLYLNLSHNNFTDIQLTSGVFPFTNALDTLDLSSNRLLGQIPMPKSSAHFLDYSSNRFSSVLRNFTMYLAYTSYFSMSKNYLSGHIPYSICKSGMEVLDLSHNKFNGPVPSCLLEGQNSCPRCGVQSSLRVLNLRENEFEGTFPSNIAKACSLQIIDLHNNKIEGKLPSELSNCQDLEILDFGSNQIADTFPSWLRGLPQLYVIILGSNRFYGAIGDIVGDTKSEECFPSLRIIDLGSNNFSGNLRPQWFKRLKSMMTNMSTTGQIIAIDRFSDFAGYYQGSIEITYKGSYISLEKILTTFTAIDFSNNSLEGTIPESIGRLVSLRVLNMSNNAFTGKIPAKLGGMTDLESLDLSCNQLSGEIPEELTGLTFLDVLNLSNNHLVGKIPQAHQFSTFNSSSFEGNAGLWGPPLSELPCGASNYTPSYDNVNKSVDVVLFLFSGLGFGIGFAAAIVVKWDRVRSWFTAAASVSQTRLPLE
ncbi:hypothetical protein U9M48_040970 [Paspalum notatum var. saurae]|uniref:Leucine-rich repeat-containing N-terminal plant-type domain-containing protein n=1 Tax=Paspalum notatum var. saurae TaxID=547442 RepID=A0AAQ3XDR2_PASNO